MFPNTTQRNFYDAKYSGQKVYSGIGRLWNIARKRLRANSPVTEERLEIIRAELGSVASKRILEIGPGEGTMATRICAESAEAYVAVDISKEAVVALNRKFTAKKLDNAMALCADAANTAFESGSFDVIIGFGVLHHFDRLNEICCEVSRLLSPAGKAIFFEPLNNNPIVVFGRFLTRYHRRNLRWEHPFSWREINTIRSHFPSSEIHLFDGVSSLAMFCRLLPFPRAWYTVLCRKLAIFDKKIAAGNGLFKNLFLSCVMVLGGQGQLGREDVNSPGNSASGQKGRK